VKAPTSKRATRWDATNGLITTNASTTDVDTPDTITWQSLVDLKAYAKEQYVRGVKEDGGEEVFHVFMTPKCMSRLKMDNDYMLNLRHSTQSGVNQKLFTGGSVKVDGMYLHEFRHVYHSSTWGGGAINGCQVLMCGAQALGMADLGSPEWVEKGFDYENQQGISTSKIVGLLKPQFTTQYSGNTLQDHGVLSMYVSQ
jgi:N4-gp56 family major capsid protein